MKRLSPVICIAVALLLWMPAALADTVQVGYPGSSYGAWQTNRGGEFTWTPQPGSSLVGVASHYASTTSGIGVAGSFQSFCLEFDEYIYGYPTIYNYGISGAADAGGVGGPTPDPISMGTAWLYSQFATGSLAGYDYLNTGVGRHTSAAALQNTIWWLEGEAADPGASSIFRTAVASAFSNEAGAMADANGKFGVGVLNLTLNGAPAQDQLVMVPEPDAWLLLGVLLVGLVARVVPRRSS